MDTQTERPAQRSAGAVAVVIVAAGRGERAGQGGEGPKQYRPIGGKAVIRHTLEAFAANARIGPIAVAVHPDDRAAFAEATNGLAAAVIVVDGGASRQASTRLALRALADAAPAQVLIHDGVRPFVDQATIDRVIEGMDAETGALPALAVADTLKRAGPADTIAETVSRHGLFAAQTPQGFPFEPILQAHEKAFADGRDDFTDDAAIAEWAGLPAKIVAGAPDNVKLTWARDIALAEARLSPARAGFPDVRTGNGYDVHVLAEGDHVMLCGVRIAHDRRLAGHSDADVGLHALTDALLATCGGGDIGTHFPPSESRWQGASSRVFVEHAAGLVRRHGGRIANADITLICEAPKIAGHRAEMIETVATMLQVTQKRVSIKATTNETLGFVGRREGIAAIATASVVYPGELPE